MKLQTFFLTFPVIGALAAPLAPAGKRSDSKIPILILTEDDTNLQEVKRSEATVPIFTIFTDDGNAPKHAKRSEASIPIFTVFASDTEQAKKVANQLKRGQDIDNLVLSVTVFTDDQPEKAKRGEIEQTKRGQDIDNLVLSVTVFTDDQPEKEKRGQDIDNLVLSVNVADVGEKEKRGQDIDNLVLSVNVADVGEKDKREPKLVSPYTDDVEAADPHVVLGEKH